MYNTCIKENHKLEQVVRQYVTIPEHWHAGMRQNGVEMPLFSLSLSHYNISTTSAISLLHTAGVVLVRWNSWMRTR